MRLFRLEQSQVLPVSLRDAWNFFSDPANLVSMTPPRLNLVPNSPLPEAMYPGLVITYKVKIAPLVSVNWVTEITQVQAPHLFVDEQRFGPYKFWHHLHRFSHCGGGVLAEDVIHYGLYGGAFASFINRVMVRRQLSHIFRFRKEALMRIFDEGNHSERWG